MIVGMIGGEYEYEEIDKATDRSMTLRRQRTIKSERKRNERDKDEGRWGNATRCGYFDGNVQEGRPTAAT
jgi:hypothetical protein